METRVYDLAHARSGDKGNTLNVGVFAYSPNAWKQLHEQLTEQTVLQAYSHLGATQVTRYEIESLQALNFVIKNVLAGGVTRSLRLDPHGKSLSALMLGILLTQPTSFISD